MCTLSSSSLCDQPVKRICIWLQRRVFRLWALSSYKISGFGKSSRAGPRSVATLLGHPFFVVVLSCSSGRLKTRGWFATLLATIADICVYIYTYIHIYIYIYTYMYIDIHTHTHRTPCPTPLRIRNPKPCLSPQQTCEDGGWTSSSASQRRTSTGAFARRLGLGVPYFNTFFLKEPL